MYEQTRHLKAKTGDCPFRSQNLKSPVEIFANIIEKLPLGDIGTERFQGIADTIIAKLDQDSDEFKILSKFKPEQQLEFLAKGVLYKRTEKHLAEIVDAVFSCKEQAQETLGLGLIQDIAFEGTVPKVQYKAVDPKSFFEVSANPVSLAFAITRPILANARSICCDYSENLKTVDEKEHKLLETLVSLLPGRVVSDPGMWMSGGFEAAILLPMDLYRVNFYRCIIQTAKDGKPGQLGKDFTDVHLEKIAKNSRNFLSILATTSFDTINAQREFTSTRHSDGRFELKHGHFYLNGNLEDSDLHVDYKLLPIAGGLIDETELICGCPGMQWVGKFHDWSLELHSKYFLPELPRLHDAAFAHILEEGDTSAEDYLKYQTQINRDREAAGLSALPVVNTNPEPEPVIRAGLPSVDAKTLQSLSGLTGKKKPEKVKRKGSRNTKPKRRKRK